MDEFRFSSARLVYAYGDAMVNYMHNVVVQRSNFFGGFIMVWGGILCDVKTNLHFFDSGSLNASTCIGDILLNYTVPYMIYVGAGSLFMQDNTILHVA